jgi:tetratricopeptide (TPR) repeat protein
MAEPEVGRSGGSIADLRRAGKRLGLVLAIVAAASSASGADVSVLDGTSLIGSSRYARCLDLVKRDAGRALEAANAWAGAGGGAAALHCSALALTAQRRYPEAAAKLDEAAHDAMAGDASVRAQLLDQAGNAWMLAGRADKAVASLSGALAFAPNDADLEFDRARARAMAKDWAGAETDLTAIIAADPNRADVLVLRASARHAQGRRADARADLERALGVYPDYPDALVERGEMKLEAGDRQGAAADWQQVLRDAPNSDAGAAARAHLGELGPTPTKAVRH